MDRHVGRYLLITFAVSLLFIFLVIKIFGGHHASPKTNTPAVKSLPDYASTYAQVSYTLDGPINGDDQHRAIRITIDRFQRTVDIIGGYNGNLIKEKSIANNQQAYKVFLTALQQEGFNIARKNTKITDETAQCPLGTRSTYELNDGGNVLSRLWTTSCGGSLGTLGVDDGPIQELFRMQITNYDQIISDSNVDL